MATFELNVNGSDDVIDVRDIIERVEELRLESHNPEADPELVGELKELEKFLSEIAGNGGDHNWEDNWYPVTLIKDSYFEEYAQELASDLYGPEISNAHWPFNQIDWSKAAEALQDDYTTEDLENETYWMR